MKEIIAILALVGLLCLGGYMIAEALDSAAAGWATGQMYQMQRDVSIAQIEAQTQIRLRELQMLESAYTRGMFAALFLPAVTVIVMLLAAGVWLMVWRELRRPPAAPTRQLPGEWRPAIEAPRRYSRFEWETLQMEAEAWERVRR
jgi:hypothetical protein